MYHKRKRSDDEISSSSCLLSSPVPTSDHAPNSLLDPSMPQQPSFFSSRTHKRHRDNRPSETDVHQHTLSLLYTAQRGPSSLLPPSMQAPTPMSSPTTTHHPPQQSSLHSFWAFPPTRHSSPTSTISSPSSIILANSSYTTSLQPANCESCDASLLLPSDAAGDGMDVDMMIGEAIYGVSPTACQRCGKHVCHSCAVSNLGAERRCLRCKGAGGKGN